MARYFGFDADRLIVRDNDFSVDVQFDDKTGPWLRDMLESKWPSDTRKAVPLEAFAEPTEPGLYVPANADMEHGENDFVLYRDSFGIWNYAGGTKWNNGSRYASWHSVLKNLDGKCFPLRRLKIAED